MDNPPASRVGKPVGYKILRPHPSVVTSLCDETRKRRYVGLGGQGNLSGPHSLGLRAPITISGSNEPTERLSVLTSGLSDRSPGLCDLGLGYSPTRAGDLRGTISDHTYIKRAKLDIGVCVCDCCDHQAQHHKPQQQPRENYTDEYKKALKTVTLLTGKVEDLNKKNKLLFNDLFSLQKRCDSMAENSRQKLSETVLLKNEANASLKEALKAKSVLESSVEKLSKKVEYCDKEIKSLKKDLSAEKKTYKKSYKSLMPRAQKIRIDYLFKLIKDKIVSDEAKDNGRAESELKEILCDVFETNPQLRVGDMLRLSAASDILFCEKFNISQNARRQMNHFLRTELIEKIVLFAKNNEVQALREKLSKKGDYFFHMRDLEGSGVLAACMWHCNIKNFISERVQALQSSDKFTPDPDQHNGNVWVGVNIDAGNGFTKVSLNIGNISDPNSVDNHSLIGVYAGDDCREHLLKALPELVDQINELKVCEGIECDYDIERFLVGDMKMLCSVLGHSGASSRKPCAFCESTNRVLIENQWSKTFTPRTLQSYIDLSTTSEAKRKEMSVCGAPIFNIPLTHVVPSSLHIVMGLTDLVMTAAEEICFSLDNSTPQTLGPDRKSVRKLIREQKALVEKNRCLLNGIDLLIKDSERTSAIFDKHQRAALEPRRGGYSGRCFSSYCVFLDKVSLDYETTSDTEKVKCCGCSRYVHLACENILGKELVDDLSRNDHFCSDCLRLSLNDLISGNDRLKTDMLRDKTNCEAAITSGLRNISDGEKALTGNTGEHYKKLQEACKQLGADPSAWHQKWTGNQCYRLLHSDGPDKILAIFPVGAAQQDVRVNALGKTLKLLGRIQSFTRAQFLSDNDIDQFENIIKDFVLSLPSGNITAVNMQILNVEINGAVSGADLEKILRFQRGSRVNVSSTLPPPATPTAPRTHGLPKGKVTKRTCYLCGNYGHYASTCRMQSFLSGNAKGTPLVSGRATPRAGGCATPRDTVLTTNSKRKAGSRRDKPFVHSGKYRSHTHEHNQEKVNEKTIESEVKTSSGTVDGEPMDTTRTPQDEEDEQTKARLNSVSEALQNLSTSPSS